MWGIVAGIVGASVALAVLETSLRSIGGGSDKPEKPGALPEPDKNFKKAPDGKYTAPLWQSTTAREALKRAKKFMK